MKLICICFVSSFDYSLQVLWGRRGMWGSVLEARQSGTRCLAWSARTLPAGQCISTHGVGDPCSRMSTGTCHPPVSWIAQNPKFTSYSCEEIGFLFIKLYLAFELWLNWIDEQDCFRKGQRFSPTRQPVIWQWHAPLPVVCYCHVMKSTSQNKQHWFK